MTVAVQVPIKHYIGNGSAVSFAFPFRVIDAADLRVYLNQVEQVSGFTVTGLDDDVGGAVVFSSPPANGVKVTIQRLITLDRETDFQESSAIPTDTLDRDLDRLTMMVQDGRASALEIVGGDLLDAKGQRIINLATPVNGNDAVNKTWAETAMSSQLAQATAQAGISTTKAGEAASSASAAAASAAAALASKNAAATSEANAAASASTASTYKDHAFASETNAAASAADALASKNAAATSATNAAASAAAAAASALQAAEDAQYSADTKQEIIDALADGSVASINGRGGIVVLDASDVGLENVDNTSDADKPISTAQQTAITAAAPVGSVQYFAGPTAPAGWLICDGSPKSRTTYAALFAVIGTIYGSGDGSTTFNVPDMRGVAVRGLDSGRGLDAGRTLGTYQGDAFASHAHAVTDPTHNHGISDPGHSHYVNDPGHSHSAWTDSQGSHAHSQSRGHSAGVGTGVLGALGLMMDGYENISTSVNGAHGHGVGVGGSGTGIWLSGSGTGIGTYGNPTGISIQANGGSETRMKNIALHGIIKY